MALHKARKYEITTYLNEGIFNPDQIQLVGLSSAPSDDNLTDGRIYYNSTTKTFMGRANGQWVSLSGTGGIGTWDELYDNDKTLDIDSGVLTFTVSGATNGLYINKTNTGPGVPLVIANAGTGYDIQGPTWSIISNTTDGIAQLELGEGGTINAESGDLTIGKSGTLTIFNGDISVNGNVEIVNGNVEIIGNSLTFISLEGGVLANLKNSDSTTVSGTPRTIEISLNGVPYYFLVYPAKG